MKISIIATALALIIAPTALAQRQDNYLAVKVEKVQKDGLFTIYGNLRKNSGGDCRIAQVTFNLYDKQNRLIGKATDMIENLPDYTNWRFSAVSFDDTKSFSRYQLASKTCQE